MITEAGLLAAGYRAYKANERLRPYASRLFQKWIQYNNGTKLFAVNFWEYLPIPELGPSLVTYQPEARFYLPSSNGGGFDVIVYDRMESIEEVETFFMRCYVGLGCQPDMHNQG